MTALREKQNQLGIASHHHIQDVLTRWNATFLMLEHLVEQRVAILLFFKYLDLKQDQWELVMQIVTVLKLLQIATTVISSV